LNSFEEAFATLIREIETIKHDNISKHINKNEKPNKTTHHPHGTGFSATDTVHTLIGVYSKNVLFIIFFVFIKESKHHKVLKQSSEPKTSIADWDTNAVKQWLERVGLIK